MQSFLKNARYVLGSIWHEESNRKQRVKHLFLFFGWQVWKRVVQTPLSQPMAPPPVELAHLNFCYVDMT